MSPDQADPVPQPASAAATSAPPPQPASAAATSAPPAPTQSAPPESAPPESAPAQPAPPAASGDPSPWPERLTALGASTLRWIGQPRVRLAAVGILLLLIGGVIIANSVWTLPLVVVGALMVVVAWIGRRLDGRFAVEWGESGTEVLFRATIKAPAHEAQLPSPAPAEAASLAGPAAATAGAGRAEGHDEVIEGEAHTIEIDVADLKALIAAVETAEARAAETEPPAPDFRLRRSARGMPASDVR